MGDLTHRFTKLLLGQSDEVFDSAAQLVQQLWRENSASCEQVLTELLRVRPPQSDLLDEIALASRTIADPRYEDALFRIMKSSGVTSHAKQMLMMFLISKGHAGAIERFDKSFESVCERFLIRKVDDASLVATVKQACMLRRTHLHPIIGEMLDRFGRTGKYKPTIHIFERQIIETLYLGLRDGRIALRAIFDSSGSSFSQKEAAIYGLGCECSSDLHEYFALAWQRHSGPHEFPIRRECVNAIIYSCHPNDIATFLADQLISERNRYSPKRLLFWHFSSNREADIVRLLLGAKNSPLMDERLEEAIRTWFDVEGPDGPHYAALAHLALEVHNRDVFGDDQCWYGEELRRERHFCANHFDYCSLLTSRNMFRQT